MVVGPVPEQREDGGVVESRHRGEPAELPRILLKGEILAGKGDDTSGGVHSHGRNEEDKRLFKNPKTKGEKGRRLLFVWSAVLSRYLSGTRERGDEV